MSDASDVSQFEVLEQLRAKTAIVADWPYKRHPLLKEDGTLVISQVTDQNGQRQNYAVWLEKDAEGKFSNYVFLDRQGLRDEYDKREDAKPDQPGGQAKTFTPTGKGIYQSSATGRQVPADSVELVYYKPDTGEIVGTDSGGYTGAYHDYWTGTDPKSGKDDILVSVPEAQKLRLALERAKEKAGVNNNLPEFPVSKGQGELREVKSALVPKTLIADGKLSEDDLTQALNRREYSLTQIVEINHSADSMVKAKAEPVLAEFVRKGSDELKYSQKAHISLNSNYIVTQARITFEGLPTQVVTPAASVAPASAKQTSPPAVSAGQSDGSIVSELRVIAARETTESVDSRLLAKANLKIRKALDNDPSASKPETQDKIRQVLNNLQGLNEADKIAAAKIALARIEGGAKPVVASTFNTASGMTTPARDNAAELRAVQEKLAGTQVNDDELRAQALQKARAFIAGKESEVQGIIEKQKPEIRAQAQAFMARVDSVNSELVEGTVRDVVSQARLNFSEMSTDEITRIKEIVKAVAGEKLAGSLTPQQIEDVKRYVDSHEAFKAELTDTDIGVLKARVKSLAAEEIAKATSPAEVQRVVDNLDMNALFHKAADKSLSGLEEMLAKTPTTGEIFQKASQGLGELSRSLEQQQQAQEAERQRIREMKENDPEAYKAFCKDTKNLYNPVVGAECTDALKTPKM